jgi:hypothetical protein
MAIRDVFRPLFIVKSRGYQGSIKGQDKRTFKIRDEKKLSLIIGPVYLDSLNLPILCIAVARVQFERPVE